MKGYSSSSSTHIMNYENSDTNSEKANSLQIILTSRLTNHICRRIKKRRLWKNWCLKWAATNVAQMAAMMVICNHIQR